MAIQEIEKKSAVGTVGIERSINEAATGMIMDIVQAQQYQKPIPSTVRELAANAVDSQSEKEKALKILSGKAKPEDYFIKREGALYEDSKWNPDYYDVNHLDTENNEIILTYKEGEGTGRCDKFIIKDFGVGIGARRLKGVLEVGFSTKRNRKDALGAFGLGAKVGLSTGADYYKMTTVYNGIKYQVQIFNKKVNSLVGKFNLETEKKNIPYEFKNANGDVVGIIYGEETTEKNYTEIEVPCLKHHRSEFETAVKTQLLFFTNVKFCREDIHGDKYDIPFKAEVLHNSDNLIIAKDTPYAKPFVVIVNGDNAVGVCYGHIDFKELEIQDMHGAVGIKGQIRQTYDDPETGDEIIVTPGVDVIASREAIRWTGATREFLMEKFEDAQHEATDLVQDKLKENDFLKWLAECKNISSLSGQDTTIGRLSRIIDLKNVKPKFAKTKLAFHPIPGRMLGDGIYPERNSKFQDSKDGEKFKTERVELDGWAYYNHEAIYVREGSDRSRFKDVYLADEHDGKFILLNVKSDEDIMKFADRLATDDKKDAKLKADETLENRSAKHYNKIKDKQESVLKMIKASLFYKSYDDVVIPEDYKATLLKLETGLEEKAEEEKILTNAERRELEERVVANTYIPRVFSYASQYDDTYKKLKVEPKFKDIKSFEGDLYYGFQTDESKLQYAACIMHPTLHNENNKDGKLFDNDTKKLLSVSKSNKKHFANHSHIDDFFGKQVLVKKDDKVVGLHIIMDNIIVKWNTARIMKERMGDLSFFSNFEIIDKGITDLYKEVSAYMGKHHRDTDQYITHNGFKAHNAEFTGFLDTLQKFQERIEQNPDNLEEIAEYAKELALPGGTTGGLAVDTEMLEKLEVVLSYAKPVRELLNHIDILCLSGAFNGHSPTTAEITLELGMFIKDIIALKGATYTLPEVIEEVDE